MITLKPNNLGHLTKSMLILGSLVLWYPPRVAGQTPTTPRTYYISPAQGIDQNDGSQNAPWKTFAPLNQITLNPGDRIEIVSPGELTESLIPRGKGTAQHPITIHFAPGRYDWIPGKLATRKLNISNTNDDPQGDKTVAIELDQVSHINLGGQGAQLFCRGKMVNIHFNQASHIAISDLSFDYHRPTVSEFKVDEVKPHEATITIHKDSAYTIDQGKVIWVGEGWRHPAGGYGQTFRPTDKSLWRSSCPLGNIDRAEELAPGKLKVHFKQNPGFEQGFIYQNRDTRRDCAGVFCNRSENIVWNNVHFNFVHGMGIVSQFTKDIAFSHLEFAPRKDSGRTCAAWADMLHFSGCTGKILVDSAHFSGSNDDPINIHGTYLRVTEKVAPQTIKVRFMHPQTYGFEAFVAGDEIEFINRETLLPYGKTQIVSAKMLNEKEMELQLKSPVPNAFQPNDAIENITWTPSVHIRNCLVEADPTRGFLISTRKPVVVENCLFKGTNMSALLIAGDVNSWFESGAAQNMTIRNNMFAQCAEPVILFQPENSKGTEDHPIHSNIKISNNYFQLRGQNAISLKSTGNVSLRNNYFSGNWGTQAPTLDQLVHRHLSPPFQERNNSIEKKN